MNRRKFFSAPCLLVPAALVTSPASAAIRVGGHALVDRGWVDETLIPALRDAIDNRDLAIIGPNSKQAIDLKS